MRLHLSSWFLITAAIAVAAPPPAGLLDDIQEANSNLATMIRNQGAINVAMVQSTLARRSGLIAQLIAEDPQAVKPVALPADLVDRLRLAVPNAGSWIEDEGEWTGSLEVLAVMDLKFEKAKTRRFLHLLNGRVDSAERLDPAERIEMFGGAKTFHHTDSVGGATLHIHGIRIQGVVAVDSIQATSTLPPISPIGIQSFAVIVVTSAGNPTFPPPWNVPTPTLLSMINDAVSGTSGVTLNTFWQSASYGLTSAQGKVFGPFVVPNYSCTGVDDTEALRKSAMAAAAGTVDFTQYNRYAIVFPNNNCGYGGTASVGPWTYPEVPGLSSISWYPIFSGQTFNHTVQVFAHEAGHNLGQNHANSIDYGAIPLGAPGDDGINTEYGDYYSTMGSATGPSFWQYTAPEKVKVLGWLDSSTGYQEVSSPGNFTVAPLEATTGIRALRILRPANPGLPVTWLWIEFRQTTTGLGLDDMPAGTTTNVYSGVLVHYENPDLEPLHSYLLDFNPTGIPNNYYTAAMTPGQTWADPYSPLHLTVNSVSTSGATVRVAYDTSCATLAMSGGPFPTSGGSGTITVTADPACSWSATTQNNWIAMGTAAGQGNGSIPFTVAANSGTGPRTGSISLQRQTLGVLQEGQGISAISVSPNFGSGFKGPFTFVVGNSKGYTDFDYVNGDFNDNHGHRPCYFSFQRAGTIFLFSTDTTAQTIGTVTLNRPGSSITNGTCTIFSDGSSVSGVGDFLTLTLNIEFTGAETGVFEILVLPHTSAGYTGPVVLGSFNIQAPQSVIKSVSTASGGSDIAQNTFIVLQGTNLVPNDTPAVGVIWSSAPSFASGQMPTQLNGVSVTVDHKPAFIYFFCSAATSKICASDQINLLTPLDNFTGQVPIVVTYTNSAGTTTSLTYTANLKTVAPALLLFPQSYVAATHSDGTLVGPTTLYPGASTPAKAGEQIVLYGVGFGLPSTTLVDGSSSQSGSLSKLPVCAVGKNSALVAFAGLIGPGLYQLNLTVPGGSPSGDNAISCTYQGAATPAGDLITVSQ